MYDIKRTITGTEPITINELKLYLKIDYTTDDTLLTELITAARQQAEEFCNRSFIAQTIDYYETDYSSPVRLPFPNHSAIISVKINDEAISYGVTGLNQFIVQLFGTVIVDSDTIKELKIQYTTTGVITAAEKNAIMKCIADMYENRSMTITSNAYSWLMPHKIY